VVVAGRSKNVGMPIAMLLHTDGEHERPGGERWFVQLIYGVKAWTMGGGIADVGVSSLLLW
jgi:hypothetical protein